jgi:hypothetical protein
MRKTAYLQHDLDIQEVEMGRAYCEFCLLPLKDSYDSDRFGNYEVFIQEDREGVQLLGYICRACVEKEEREIEKSLHS